jgi:hypothetical protein
MQKLWLTKRPGHIGGRIPTRTTKTEQHGREEVVPATAIPIASVPLTPEEFGEILGDAGSHDAFITKDRSKFAEPRWRDVPYIPFKGKFKGAKVTLQVRGVKYILKPATVENIKFIAQGDQVVLLCTVNAPEPEEGLRVGSMLNQPCNISIQGGSMADKSDEQGELGLEGGGPAETDDPETLADVEREEEEATRRATGDEDEPVSRMGRKIQNTARKSSKKQR